jgi:hypothetical protein
MKFVSCDMAKYRLMIRFFAKSYGSQIMGPVEEAILMQQITTGF